ncbi:hypothetical protein EMIHUDRAFT_219713 [Emiliania huxleyi CCMP1516]|uniref:Apple domain-containing protein n=2 Tax=Emiliania huxleyi TaxID=2903 RepID=A0A0D3I3Z2_EMIH1|nr:hypothetical protein EMIHUDRAFT_219713 [Emiliania huxleyi CCMP1516]EOD05977.1 hypothetical protein EMIHUDRAFT_219713 [Emiliania huxleyi CCMP1516]|eukprot:XP_005758406.1 hypothetical protein EMIHUDRAFT_219713 [Emiliania huxleyi CCMP1516]
MERTELSGDVVRWGADHKVSSAAACCTACLAEDRCSVWVYCAGPACGAQAGECWLKTLADPFSDVDLVRGRSDRWTSGTRLPPPPAGATPSRTVPASEAHLLLRLADGLGSVRLRLRDGSPKAKEWALVDQHADCHGCTFYRAEAVPPHWGSPDWPDTYEGGRWGPPYALVQGGLSARGAAEPPRVPREDNPVVRRGMAAWAGGGSGPAFFIALADHPEWGRGHTVFADAVTEDIAALERILALPTKTTPGKIPITNLVTPAK